MSAINDIQSLLNNQIGDGRYRLQCEVEPTTQNRKDLIMLFYTGDDNAPLAHSQNKKDGYYSIQIECAVRHKQKDKARDIAFQAFELLGSVRRQNSVSLFFTESPTYKGIDTTNAGHIYSFVFLSRGKK